DGSWPLMAGCLATAPRNCLPNRGRAGRAASAGLGRAERSRRVTYLALPARAVPRLASKPIGNTTGGRLLHNVPAGTPRLFQAVSRSKTGNLARSARL